MSEKQTFLFSEKDIRGNFSDKMTRAASLTKKTEKLSKPKKYNILEKVRQRTTTMLLYD